MFCDGLCFAVIKHIVRVKTIYIFQPNELIFDFK